MGYAAKLGSSSKAVKVISCGSYTSRAARTIRISNYTTEYKNMVLNKNIFLGAGVTKNWVGKADDEGRKTLNLSLSYNKSTGVLTVSKVESYTGSGYGDYLTYSVYVVVY